MINTSGKFTQPIH